MPKGTITHSLAFAMVLATVLATTVATPTFAANAPVRTLRVGLMRIPETFDPVRTGDMMVWYLIAGIYDTLYVLDPVARPAAIVPTAAAALPEFPLTTARLPSASGPRSSSHRTRASAESRVSLPPPTSRTRSSVSSTRNSARQPYTLSKARSRDSTHLRNAQRTLELASITMPRCRGWL